MFYRSTIRGLILRVNNNYNLYNRFYQQPLPLTKNLSYHVNSKDVIIKPDRSDRSLLCLKFYSTGQHFTKDGEETVKERDRTSTSKTKQWNEKLATHSEAGIRAEKDNRGPEALQKETTEQFKESSSTITRSKK